MRNFKPLFIATLGLLFPAKVLFAQQAVDAKIAKNYSQEVVVRVYSVVSKVSLPADKQVQLANYFKANSDALAAAALSGKPPRQIDSLRRSANSGLQKILTPEQFAKYSSMGGRGRRGANAASAANANSKTRIGSVLADTQQYNLSSVQTDSLNAALVQMGKLRSSFRKSNAGSKFDGSGFEFATLQRILTTEQYHTFLILKNTSQAKTWAVGDWAEIKKRGLDKGLDSATTVNQIINYNSNRLAAKDLYKNDPEQMNAHVKAIDAGMPAVSKQLKASKNYSNPTGANAATVKVDYAW